MDRPLRFGLFPPLKFGYDLARSMPAGNFCARQYKLPCVALGFRTPRKTASIDETEKSLSFSVVLFNLWSK